MSGGIHLATEIPNPLSVQNDRTKSCENKSATVITSRSIHVHKYMVEESQSSITISCSTPST